MHYLACDLGAESGRLIAGSIVAGKLSLQELHRFPNVPQRIDGLLRWNLHALISGLYEGLRRAAKSSIPFASISTDSWGVDYILFDAAGKPMEPIYHYRDPRTERAVEQVLRKIDWSAIFEETGIQFMPINTLFQLAAEDPARLRQASFLLDVGDAFNFLLSGTPKIEVSMASTFQLYNPRTRSWADKLLHSLNLPPGLLPDIVSSGTKLGSIRSDVQTETGIGKIEVIATCSHDTGAAVAGVPAEGHNWAYLSSGTWSLMGVELEAPVINQLTRELNFTNEIGWGNSVRLLKNISGLWVLQECRRGWAAQGEEFDYRALTALAREAEPFRSLIDPSSPEFLAPKDMLAQIAQYCTRTGQPSPQTVGQFVRCILESLALLYRRTLADIERIVGYKIHRLHIVGGGSNNDCLNQFAANALQIPVFPGPAEATAAGNVIMQAIALGHLPSLSAGRQLIRDSFNLREFQPQPEHAAVWDRAFARFSAFSSFRGPLGGSETAAGPR